MGSEVRVKFWRLMTVADLSTVESLAARIHPAYPEDRAVFAERVRLFPAGCFLAEEKGLPLGYGLSHPSLLGRSPPLNSLLGALPETPDCLYLHDLALLPEARRGGLGAALTLHLVSVAAQHGLDTLALTAVAGADSFWQKLGFRPREGAALTGYGDAVYMLRPVVLTSHS